MGKSPSYKPLRLAEKILNIRRQLGLSQNGLIRHLGLSDELFQGDISAFELGNRVPDLRTLLLLAQASGVYVDVLVDDSLDLPDRLPANPKSAGIKRKNSSNSSFKPNVKSQTKKQSRKRA
jgi:transcriptional regulator with XRE-family HTH domain